MPDKTIYADYSESGRTDLYIVMNRPADAYLLANVDGTFEAAPAPYPLLTEHAAQKQTYVLTITGPLGNGEHPFRVYAPVGATQDPDNDDPVAGDILMVKDDAEVVLDSIMSRLGAPAGASVSADVAALPTVAQISAAVVALGGIGGIITGVVDAGVTVSSSFNPISMEKGEKKIIAYQIKEDDVAIDVSAYTFTFGVKRDLYDTTYAFATVAGVVSADDDGTLSIVTFTIPKDSTKALAVIESGRYSVGMYDIAGNKAALTPPGGVSFRLTEDILDVA